MLPSLRLSIAVLLALFLTPSHAKGRMLGCDKTPFSTLPFCDTTLSTDARVADAVSRMSLDEKISAMTGAFGSPFVECGGAGPIASLGGFYMPNHAECLHGVAYGCTTQNGTKLCPTLFPNGQMMGATFNRTLFKNVGDVIGTEARALNNLQRQPSGYSCWSPDLNLMRDPRWGRSQEVPGESPYLHSEYGVAYASGMQTGEDTRYIKTVSSPKHFLAYDLEGLGPNNETGLCTADKGTWPGAVPYPDGGPDASPQHVCRYNYNATISDRDLVEYYLPAWHSIFTRADALGFMCSYNAVNSVPSCANHWAITELARDQWGFSGYVVSDCLALQVMMQAHEYLPYDIPLAAATAINAGVDYNCGCVIQNGTAAAIARGLTNQTMVDASIARILHVLYALGEFDPEVPYRDYGVDHLDTPGHRALALEAAQQGAVLLKNSGASVAPSFSSTSSSTSSSPILPLSPTTRLAFIGPNANDAGVMASSYGGDNDLINSHTPWLAAKAAGLNVTLTHGCDVNQLDKGGFDAAVAAARAADVAVLFMGLNFPFESEWGNGPDCQNDRVNLTLPGVQEDLIAAIVAVGKPVVVVLMNGGPIAVENWIGSVGACVEAFYPGELGGDAILNLLLGKVNNWGALPFTMYTNGIVARDYYKNESAGLRYDGGITHMYYTGDKGPPVYKFGYSLSYTTFVYTWGSGAPPPPTLPLTSVNPHTPTSPLISYTVNITNTGGVAGDAIALAFVEGDGVDMPLERLWQFARVTLAPGETTTVNFDASAHDLSSVKEDGSRWLHPGTVMRVVLGDRLAPLSHTLMLEGGAALQLPVFPAAPGKQASFGPLRRK